MAKTKNWEKARVLAVMKSLELAVQLQRDLPGIAQDYRDGMFASEIISKYGITRRYGVTPNVAKTAVYSALKGYEGMGQVGLRVDSFKGLVGESELENLASEHSVRSGHEMGTLAYKRGVGIHGRTPEKRSEDGRRSGLKSGSIGGRATYEKGVGMFARSEAQKFNDRSLGRRRMMELGLGIHGRTPEQMTEDGIKGGKISGRTTYESRKGVHGRTKEQMREDCLSSIISQGMTPWGTEEIGSIFALSQLPEYRHTRASCRGKRNLVLIAEAINEVFHGGKSVRNSETVCAALKRFGEGEIR